MPENDVYVLPDLIPTAQARVIEGLNQPTREEIREGFYFNPPVGSIIIAQKLVTEIEPDGKAVRHYLSKWQTPDRWNGIIVIEDEDRQVPKILTEEELSFFLDQHGLDIDFNPFKNS